MAALQLVMYVSSAGSTADRPQNPSLNVNLNLAPKSDAIDDDNAAVFADPTRRAANFSINGVTADIMKALQGAPKVKVTVEVIE